jgi:primary-amine oxidase
MTQTPPLIPAVAEPNEASAHQADNTQDAQPAAAAEQARHAHHSDRRLLGAGDPHPLSSLSPAEIEHARRLLTDAGLLGATGRISYLGTLEPHKREVLDRQPGDPVERRARAFVLDTETGTSHRVELRFGTGEVLAEAIDPIAEGQVPLLLEEHELVREILTAHPGWQRALAARGISDPTAVRFGALSAGRYELPGEEGRRIARVLAHARPYPDALPWAYPIDGLVAYIDLVAREVVEIVDDRVHDIPSEHGDYHLPDAFGPARTDLAAIEISQPEGPSFQIDGDVVTWQNWTFRIGYDMREGLVLHQLGFRDQGRVRPVIYRASVGEMVVPYGDPSPVRFWQNYFDTGEYQLGGLVNSLELGCDCLGEIAYFDVAIPRANGDVAILPNAVCLHEEDAGVLWKHTEAFTGTTDVRRARRLVISFFVTVGNYDYGFYWSLGLDGSIELVAKATGIVFTTAYDDRARPYASQVAPGLGAPYHQHLFSARLDMAVDGERNAVDEVDVERLPMGPENPFGNAFTKKTTRLRTELEAQRLADGAVGRVWHIVNPESINRFGDPVAYALLPETQPTLLADPRAVIHSRAAFATKNLWVTRYDPRELYPAGELVNQSNGSDGVATYAAGDRDIDGDDIVLWHTFGLTHFPRPEDWPVMPVDSARMVLRPVGFFDRNPTLDVPRHPSLGGTHSGDHAGHHGHHA